MTTYKTPGVYVEEISTLPPSVAEVETAIPAFIGFTQKGILNVPKKITSLKEYEDYFGTADLQKGITVIMDSETDPDDSTKTIESVVDVLIKEPSTNVMYYALQLFYANGGGPCFIVSAGNYNQSSAAGVATYTNAIDASSKVDEVTLIVLPDAPFCLDTAQNYYDVMNHALKECARLGDRFAIIDVIEDGDADASIQEFRDSISANELEVKYGGAYFPYLNTDVPYSYDVAADDTFSVLSSDATSAGSFDDASTNAAQARAIANQAKKDAAKLKKVADGLDPKDPNKQQATDDANAAAANFTNLDKAATQLESAAADIQKKLQPKKFTDLNNLSQNKVKQKIDDLGIQLTPCAAIAGVYATIDNSRGVWKAPANVSLTLVSSTNATITNYDQEGMNVDVEAGKSVNAIRPFIGRGIMVWGARTLDGNSNEWRYISVRRFFNMVEKSVQNSTYWAVFESNDKNTWVKVRAMIENYLILKWKDGALAGAKPEDAFFVRVGLGETMSPDDVLNGLMIIEIGLAAVRPAEFIVLKFSHKMQTS
jgi:phage tail sheath protein FI